MDPLSSLTARVIVDPDEWRAYRIESSFGVTIGLKVSGWGGAHHRMTLMSPCCGQRLIAADDEWFTTKNTSVRCRECRQLAPACLSLESGLSPLGCPKQGVFPDAVRMNSRAVACLALDPLRATLALDALERAFEVFVRHHSRDLDIARASVFPAELSLTTEGIQRRG